MIFLSSDLDFKPSIQNNGSLMPQNELYCLLFHHSINLPKKEMIKFLCFRPCFAVTQKVSNLVKKYWECDPTLSLKYAIESLL